MRYLLFLLSFLLLGPPAAFAQGIAGSVNLRTSPKGATAAGTPTSTNVDANIQALDVMPRGPVAITNGTVSGQAAVINTTPTGSEYRLIIDFPGRAADNSSNATTKVPTLGGRANAAAPTWTEGNQVPFSVDLSGSLRTIVGSSLPAGDNNIGNVDIVTMPSVTIGSGTVTANQGTSAAGSSAWPMAVTNTTDTIVKPGDSVNNAVRVNVVAGGGGDGKILDGTAAGQADVMASAPAGTEEGLVVRNIPSGTQTISGTVTANAGTGTLSVDSELPAAAVLADNTPNPTATVVGTFPHWWDGTTWDRAPGTSADGLLVNLGANNDVTVTGTVTVTQGTAASLKAEVVGASADNSSNATTKLPVIPCRANAAAPTFTEGNQVPCSSDLSGSQRVAVTNSPAVTLGAAIPAGANNIGDVDIASLPNEGQQTMANSISVAVASDQSDLPIKGANNVKPIYCQSTAPLDMTTATTTQLVALSGSTVIYICSYAFQTNGTASVKLVRGTGTNCATGQEAITANYDFTAQTGINRNAGGGNIVAKGNAGDAVCVTSSAAVNVHVEISYAQF